MAAILLAQAIQRFGQRHFLLASFVLKHRELKAFIECANAHAKQAHAFAVLPCGAPERLDYGKDFLAQLGWHQ